MAASLSQTTKATFVENKESELSIQNPIEAIQYDWRYPTQPTDYFPFGGSFSYWESQHEFRSE